MDESEGRSGTLAGVRLGDRQGREAALVKAISADRVNWIALKLPSEAQGAGWGHPQGMFALEGVISSSHTQIKSADYLRAGSSKQSNNEAGASRA